MSSGLPVLALVGPTGSGKSEVALRAAERLGAEIVAVDAFTVYRGMDVGTAKPSATDRRRVPHHGIDLLDPSEECTVEWFQRACRAAVGDVLDRGRLPLLVGGSGLYFRAVVDPLEMPPTDPALRTAIAQRYAGDPQAAHAALRDVDAEAARRMEPTNLRRAVRALEVLELTGRPFSDWRTAWEGFDSVYPGLRVVGLDVDRGWLGDRLDARVEGMLARGLVEEVARLRSRAPGLSRTARQAIGYAEVLAHLEGLRSLEEAVEATKHRSRRYATRQQRWFARDPRVQWVQVHQAVEVLVTAAQGRGQVAGG